MFHPLDVVYVLLSAPFSLSISESVILRVDMWIVLWPNEMEYGGAFNEHILSFYLVEKKSEIVCLR